MKKLFLLLLLIKTVNFINGQNLFVEYDVKREVMGAPKELNVPPVDLTCYYYKKANRVISFLKADYLKDYPGGVFYIKESSSIGHSFTLYRDTLQAISYFALDSMILRTHTEGGLEENDNRWFYYDEDYRQWQKLDETASIQGMQCHRAILKADNGTPMAEIWYNPEIEMPVGMRNLINVPGLIVKATYFGTHETFTLKSFSTTSDIPDEVFWPKEFNYPFKKYRDLKRKK